MKNITEEDINFFLGIRYVHGGNSFAGTDCYGLIKLFNKRVFNKDIGEYERTAPQLACRSINSFYKKIVEDGIWKEVLPYTGCTVVTSNTIVNNERIADHVGIFIEPNKILSVTLVDRYTCIKDIVPETILGFYEFV